MYQPRVMAAVAVTYVNAQLGINEQRELVLAGAAAGGAGGVDWSAAEELDAAAADLEQDPEPDAAFGEPAGAMSAGRRVTRSGISSCAAGSAWSAR